MGRRWRACGGDGAASDPVTVTVVRADGVKCQRCWRYVPEVSTEPAFEGICSRCVDALASVVR